MLSTIIVLVKTVTSAEEKTANALIFKKKSLLTSTAMIAVSLFTGKTVLPLTKESCVSDSKSVPSAVKRTSFQRKRNMCVVNIDAPIAKAKCCRIISATYSPLKWTLAIFSTRPMK